MQASIKIFAFSDCAPKKLPMLTLVCRRYFKTSSEIIQFAVMLHFINSKAVFRL